MEVAIGTLTLCDAMCEWNELRSKPRDWRLGTGDRNRQPSFESNKITEVTGRKKEATSRSTDHNKIVTQNFAILIQVPGWSHWQKKKNKSKTKNDSFHRITDDWDCAGNCKQVTWLSGWKRDRLWCLRPGPLPRMCMLCVYVRVCQANLTVRPGLKRFRSASALRRARRRLWLECELLQQSGERQSMDGLKQTRHASSVVQVLMRADARMCRCVRWSPSGCLTFWKGQVRVKACFAGAPREKGKIARRGIEVWPLCL